MWLKYTTNIGWPVYTVDMFSLHYIVVCWCCQNCYLSCQVFAAGRLRLTASPLSCSSSRCSSIPHGWLRLFIYLCFRSLSLSFHIPYTQSDTLTHSFVPRTVVDWNRLHVDENIVLTPTACSRGPETVSIDNSSDHYPVSICVWRRPCWSILCWNIMMLASG